MRKTLQDTQEQQTDDMFKTYTTAMQHYRPINATYLRLFK